ncbi:MAG: hypothetical protein AVDCRST_MAG49-884, partial [uncultured Thermomicrobiales bacterium]
EPRRAGAGAERRSAPAPLPAVGRPGWAGPRPERRHGDDRHRGDNRHRPAVDSPLLVARRDPPPPPESADRPLRHVALRL